MTATVTVLRTPYERGFQAGKRNDPPAQVEDQSDLAARLFNRGWRLGRIARAHQGTMKATG